MRHFGWVVGLAVAVTGACTSTTPNDTTDIAWVVQNSCSGPVQLKFFDRTNGGAWPNTSQAYVLDGGKRDTYSLECRIGAQICLGAHLRSNPNYYWGVSTDGAHGCTGCCSVCGKADPTPMSLDCR